MDDVKNNTGSTKDVLGSQDIESRIQGEAIKADTKSFEIVDILVSTNTNAEIAS